MAPPAQEAEIEAGRPRWSRLKRVVAALALVPQWASAHGGPGEVLSRQKISDTEGGFAGGLDDADFFGRSVAALGDLDGDGCGDIAVGAIGDDDGDPFDNLRGCVWVLLLACDGTVAGHQKISATRGGFAGMLDPQDQFGTSLAVIGDLDGDGVTELAVGAPEDDDGGTDRGAIWILYLSAGGTVRSHAKISATEGGFGGELRDGDRFGMSVAALGDLDGNGLVDLAVGAPGDDGASGNPAAQRGAVWVLFLGPGGTVLDHRKIGEGEGGFAAPLGDFDRMGWSLASLGDHDGDGSPDCAAGAPLTDDGGKRRGAVWVLFLASDGTVAAQQKISSTEGGFAGTLDDDDDFGWSVAKLGDVDGDDVPDIAVGAFGDGDGALLAGAVWILFMRPDGTVAAHQKISNTAGGFGGGLSPSDHFGTSVGALGDHDGDGREDLASGATGDDDGGPSRGAVWVTFLDGAFCRGDCAAAGHDGAVGIVDLLTLLERWGAAGACDLDGDGIVGITDLLGLLARWGPCP